jgi:hypothetical protein
LSSGSGKLDDNSKSQKEEPVAADDDDEFTRDEEDANATTMSKEQLAEASTSSLQGHMDDDSKEKGLSATMSSS